MSLSCSVVKPVDKASVDGSVPDTALEKSCRCTSSFSCSGGNVPVSSDDWRRSSRSWRHAGTPISSRLASSRFSCAFRERNAVQRATLRGAERSFDASCRFWRTLPLPVQNRRPLPVKLFDAKSSVTNRESNNNSLTSVDCKSLSRSVSDVRCTSAPIAVPMVPVSLGIFELLLTFSDTTVPLTHTSVALVAVHSSCGPNRTATRGARDRVVEREQCGSLDGRKRLGPNEQDEQQSQQNKKRHFKPTTFRLSSAAARSSILAEQPARPCAAAIASRRSVVCRTRRRRRARRAVARQ